MTKNGAYIFIDNILHFRIVLQEKMHSIQNFFNKLDSSMTH